MADRDHLSEVLAPYGIEVTDVLWQRYWNDAVIYNLINIVAGQQVAMKEMMEEALAKGVEIGVNKMMEQVLEMMKRPLMNMDVDQLKSMLEKS